MASVNLLKKVTTPGGHDAAGETTVFDSGVITGNGAVQNTPHGFGSVPSLVLVMLCGSSPVIYVQAVITEGVHDATNCIVTCTLNWKYRILAFK